MIQLLLLLLLLPLRLAGGGRRRGVLGAPGPRTAKTQNAERRTQLDRVKKRKKERRKKKAKQKERKPQAGPRPAPGRRPQAVSSKWPRRNSRSAKTFIYLF